MQAYGDKKTRVLARTSEHEDCGVCNPPQKNRKKKARREDRVVCRDRLLELEEEYPEIYGK